VKILGIDYGTRRIGLAVSDETQTLSRELAILSPKQFWREIRNIIAEQGIERLVIGLPLNMSGTVTDKSREVQEFSDQLQQQVMIPIEFMDERFSSQMAQGLIGIAKQPVDSLAAQIILQNYLDKQKSV
jgi:putative holliday junction resolvase